MLVEESPQSSPGQDTSLRRQPVPVTHLATLFAGLGPAGHAAMGSQGTEGAAAALLRSVRLNSACIDAIVV
jgi:hypothetical protein